MIDDRVDRASTQIFVGDGGVAPGCEHRICRTARNHTRSSPAAAVIVAAIYCGAAGNISGRAGGEIWAWWRDA